MIGYKAVFRAVEVWFLDAQAGKLGKNFTDE